MKVPIKVVAGVGVPSMPLNVMPVEPVSVASTTVAVPAVSAGWPAVERRDVDVDGERAFFAVGVAAE